MTKEERAAKHLDRFLFDGQWKHMINWTLERGKGNGKTV
jgi:hypothetical protein